MKIFLVIATIVTIVSCGVANDRMEAKEEGLPCFDWFFCTQSLSLEKVNNPKI